MVKREIVEKYIASLGEKFRTGQAREHAYRPVFETLIKELYPSIQILNDPARSEHGNPDFVFLRGDVTIGYTETKDIGIDLNKVETTKQIERYLGYSNLILTDYLEFRFFKNGQQYCEPISIGQISQGELLPFSQHFDSLANLLSDFFDTEPEPIKRGKRLAEIMGGKARRIRDNIKLYFSNKSDNNRELEKVYETINKLLVHDLTSEAFADMYAQTLVYGLFVARYYDETGDTFSRQEARDLIPKSNPFLRHFFDHIAGPNFDKRLEYIVKELCDIFALADVNSLMHQYFSRKDLFGKEHESPDPVIHFYEDFLKEYDYELRKKLGAYYTPLPVVRFIVKSVDNILKRDFGLEKGLADSSKIASPQGQVHKVQVLDPAVGTGTFLSEIVRKIYSYFVGQEGRWATYVHHDLLPRIYGFELMMAPYTIAHLKIGMMLAETKFKYFNRRLGVYLTNSLEEASAQESLFSFGLAESIAEEAKEASVIKNEKPIMVVIGNPPYSVSSSNKGKWITNLIEVYKKGLNEKNIQPLSDDYIKFIRFAEHFVEKNGIGVVAMITNNSFIDGITHRQMRKHLLETFDDIYILDLHGSSKKQEKADDGTNDENVFDIQQGVAISIFVRKSREKNKLGTVWHSELYGKRENKFEKLDELNIEKIKWRKIIDAESNYFFVHKDFSLIAEWEKYVSVKDIFIEHRNGIQTGHDNFALDINRKNLEKRIQDYFDPQIKNDEISSLYDLRSKSGWNLDTERGKALQEKINDENFTRYSYRPFDSRWIYYDKKVLKRPVQKLMDHLFDRKNYALCLNRQLSKLPFHHAFISSQIFDMCFVSLATKETTYGFPLFLYADDDSCTPNLKREIVDSIQNIVGNIARPEAIFDYIYATLHSQNYREKYKEFLKIDFPRVPYPKDKKQFKIFVALGRELREIHLLESPKINRFITTYPLDGSNTVEKIFYKDEKVFINEKQYFGNVPETAWNFYIGGYQPAQKWLKDRKRHTLTNEEIEHYQKIIVAHIETHRIMQELNKFSL